MMEIALVHGAATLALNGNGVSGAVAAARFADAEMHMLDVALQGAPEDISDAVTGIALLLFEAIRTNRQTAETWVYLQVTLADGTTWRSPVHGGWLTLARGAAGRRLNAQGVRLKLERADWWETVEPRYATIGNRHGTSSGPGGVTVYNHKDALHDNFIDIDGVNGDLPAPVRLLMDGAGMSNIEAFCGLGCYLERSQFQVRYEGESGSSGAGVTASILADAACAGGSYAGLSWSGAAEVNARHWLVSRQEAGGLAGRIFRPLLRLQSAVGTDEALWLALMAGYNDAGTVEPVYRGEAVRVHAARQMVVLPPLPLPPWPAPAGGSENMQLCLLAQAETAGAHTLNIDQLLLLPCDSFLHLMPVLTTFPAFTVEHDSQSGLLTSAGYAFGSHVAEGPGIWLAPGRAQRLVFAFSQGTGWVIDHAPVVNLQYRPRRRVL